VQYLGGKSKWGKQIVDVIRPWRQPGSVFVDVTCGALNVVRWAESPRVALGLCQPLITTLKAVRSGWEPPAKVTPDEYARIKASPNPLDPLTAFVMFGCSFGAKWGAGFAGQDPRPGRTSYAHRAKINLKDILGSCLDVEIGCLDFKDLPRPPPETVIYADIPYEGTTPYAGVPPFDHRVFWAYASWWSLCGARVFVSEGSKASPPYRWRVLKRWTIPTYLGGGTGQDREERLYVHQDSPMGRSLINV
jgi:DNA adenine methylase